MRKKKVFLITLVALLIFVSSLYLGGLLFFRNRFFPRTSVNGVDVSMLDKQKAEDLLSMMPVKLCILQKDKEGSGTVEGEIDLSNEADGNFRFDVSDALASQDPLRWFLSLFQNSELSCTKANGSFSKEKLQNALKNLYCLQDSNIREPADTHIAFVNDVLTLVDADDGSLISEEKVFSEVLKQAEAFANGSGTDLIDLRQYYEKADQNTDRSTLEKKLQELKQILDKTISIRITSSDTVQLNGKELKDLLELKDNDLSADPVALNRYLKQLEDLYDGDGEYIDSASLKADLLSCLLNKEDASLSVDWIYENQSLSEGKLIEVCYSKQTLYYYEDGQLIFSSDIVTGNDVENSEIIPSGTYYILYKKEDATLVGADFREHVDYWIGFDPQSGGHVLGIHDASWRDEFGGDIWLSNPSHGCVNMPTDKVALLYEKADIGTRIEIYY